MFTCTGLGGHYQCSRDSPTRSCEGPISTELLQDAAELIPRLILSRFVSQLQRENSQSTPNATVISYQPAACHQGTLVLVICNL